MTLIPDRATFAPGDDISITIEPALTAAATCVVWHLDQVAGEWKVPAGATSVTLGTLPIGGYGVSIGDSSTAVDVLADPFDRPRYGFVVKMTDEVDQDALALNYRRHHLSVSQFYDWAYRHSRLIAPTDRYVDPLGQVRTLSTVNSIARALRASGTIPLAYTAVYGVGHNEASSWKDSLLRRGDGHAYRFGDDFLVIVDPAEPRWLEYYLKELASVLEHTDLAGFHLDQYGWPKEAVRADGTRVKLEESFTTLLAAIRTTLPESRFMFNNVNDFPTYATATSPQDATYIEVWDPHSTLGDLGALALKARSYRPEHPPILSAYLSCYSAGNEARSNAAAQLVMASIFSHGATHLLLGEDSNVLVHAYYPNNYVLAAESREMFVLWYDFLVRYGDLLMDPTQVDVTELYTGGVNEEFVFESSGGVSFSTKAEPGTVWTRVVRVAEGFVIHLINLVDQTETTWDAEKQQPGVLDGLRLRLIPSGDAPMVLATEPGTDQRLVPVALVADTETIEVNQLSGAQYSVVFSLPPLKVWTMLYLPDPVAGTQG
jgi:dextranase